MVFLKNKKSVGYCPLKTEDDLPKKYTWSRTQITLVFSKIENNGFSYRLYVRNVIYHFLRMTCLKSIHPIITKDRLLNDVMVTFWGMSV